VKGLAAALVCFLALAGALGAGNAGAQTLTVEMEGSIRQIEGSVGWGRVVETTPAGLLRCTYPASDYCLADYGWGWIVELRADAPAGWRFAGWVQGGNGQVKCDVGTAPNVCRFQIWSDLWLGARFVDDTPPETIIDSGPPATDWRTQARFAFHSPDHHFYNPVRYQCRLDAATWARCASPTSYSGLAQGAHTFAVRGIDASGNVDPTPATRTWTIATPQCFGRYATIVGTSASERIDGTAGADVIVARGGQDVVYALGGDDRICGGDGGDSLIGGTGTDRLAGGSGNDSLSGGWGTDSLFGNAGNDALYARDGVRDSVDGGVDTDTARSDAIDNVVNVP